MIGKEVKYILENDVALGAYVGERIYADLMPQNTTTVPAIVYRIQNKFKEHTQDTINNLSTYRVEFNLYASTYGGVQELSRRLEQAFDRYPIGTQIGNYIFDGVAFEDSEDNPYDIDERGNRSKGIDFSIRVKQLGESLNYSLAEQDTGLAWVDGSPIYKRTYYLPDETFDRSTIAAPYTIIDFDVSAANALTGDLRVDQPIFGGTPSYNWVLGIDYGGGLVDWRLTNLTDGMGENVYFTIFYVKTILWQ
jgi:hypothetical protein